MTGPSTLARVMVILSLAMYGLIAGTVGGVVTARLTGYPPAPVVAPAGDVPRASDGLFSGVTGPGVEQAMTKAGYSCGVEGGGASPTRSALCRDGRTADYDISLTIAYQADGGTVTSLTGRCRPISSTATVDGCGAFIGSVPGLLYPANATRSVAARDWASRNLGADASTVIDGVYYALQLQPLLIACMRAA
jgi:hypothetical protein